MHACSWWQKHNCGHESKLNYTAFSGAGLVPQVSWPAHEACLALQVRQTLVEDRRATLETIRARFCSLDLANQLEHSSAAELATLFFEKQYLDVDALVRAFRLEKMMHPATYKPG